MKNILTTKNKKIFITTFIILFLVHLPLITKNIISADILLNNYYYKGYSWEISLGRFGLFLIGIIKSYLTIPHIDIILSYIIISISTIIILDLFNTKNKLKIILFILIITLSPITSSTLLFNYCSLAYTLAFQTSILSVYTYYKFSNKYLKYIVPAILIIITLSLYQAYFSVIITLFILYNINNKINYKSFFKFILTVLISIISYFIIMKFSQVLFHINMSSYSNADKIDLNLITSIPNKIIDSYKLLYKFYFTNSIIKNTYLHNNIINLLLLIILTIEIIINNKNINIKNKLIKYFFFLTLPIYLNSIIFLIPGTKLQLLMSSSYLLIYLYIVTLLPNNKFKYLPLFIFITLFRNNLIQVEATYLTLENTYNKYESIIKSAAYTNINNNYQYVLINKEKTKYTEINNLNYGFISDDSIFWEEYNLRKLGFLRFSKEYLGLDLNYVDENTYNRLKNKKYNKLITTKDNIIIIDLSKIN